MTYSVDWIAKIVSIPLSDLTDNGDGTYSLDSDDVRRELRRLEWEPSEGLWAPNIVKWYDGKTLGGVTYPPAWEVVNGYKIKIAASNTVVKVTGYDSNISDVFVPENGVSLLMNNSVGKITTGSGLSTEQADQLLRVFQRLDLDPNNPNTYAGDLSKISGAFGDLDKTVNPDDSVTVTRTP